MSTPAEGSRFPSNANLLEVAMLRGIHATVSPFQLPLHLNRFLILLLFHLCSTSNAIIFFSQLTTGVHCVVSANYRSHNKDATSSSNSITGKNNWTTTSKITANDRIAIRLTDHCVELVSNRLSWK
jgi:hypothetical protein